MKVKLLLNIGTKDAARLSLDPEKAHDGDTVDVKKEYADELLKRGWAVEPGADDGKPAPGATPHRTELPKK